MCRGDHRSLAAANGNPVRPVDSEHSAVWQALHGSPIEQVSRIILTASGGPFRTVPATNLARVTATEALAHPTWSMGDKITVDSATLMNKGLEIIEAHWLFGLPYDQIDVLVHPQSVVHSLVEFVDGGQIAQLGLPDMRGPIQYALTYPERMRLSPVDSTLPTSESLTSSGRTLSGFRIAARTGSRDCRANLPNGSECRRRRGCQGVSRRSPALHRHPRWLVSCSRSISRRT